MPTSYAPIPLPNRGATGFNRPSAQPAFSAPVRWTLVALSWLAFGVASYLAYQSISGGSVAGCGTAGANGCDVVLSSSWSKLFGIPVAALGLGCYAALATLSVLLGWREPNVNRWITTAFVGLAIAAALASAWFIGVQIFAIGEYCKFCLITDVCGILIGVIAVAAAVQSVSNERGARPASTLQPGLMALRTAAGSAAARTTTSAAPVALRSPPPALAVAAAGAVPLVLLLVGGQLWFPSKTYNIDQVALHDAIRLDGPSNGDNSNPAGGIEHTTLRVPDPLEGSASPTSEATNARSADRSADEANASDVSDKATVSADTAGTASANNVEAKAEPPAVEPKRERIVRLLGGKLTLNTYQHPIIGSPEAPHIVVEMVSYDCTHCRKMNSFVHKALERYGNQVAVIIMPIPLEKGCNKLVTSESNSHLGACGTAKRACGVARLNERAFVRFHDYLMSGGDKPPTTEQIVPKANGLVDRERLRQLIGSPEIKKQIEGYVDLFGQLQAKSRNPAAFGLPVQILGDQVLNGGVEKADDIYKAWEKHLGVRPK